MHSDETVRDASPGKQRKAAKKGMQPPLTPMIDVTFQLLLFFLLTCEFRQSEGQIPGSLPEGDLTGPPAPRLTEPIRIHLRPSLDRESANYEMTGVSGVITSPAELYRQLEARQRYLGSAEVPVVIFPSMDVPWEFVVEAFNQAVRAQYRRIGFAQELM